MDSETTLSHRFMSCYGWLWHIQQLPSENKVLFMKTVLEPPPVGQLASFSKAHFLIARTFLKFVNFLGRPVLNKLIYELSILFGTRYTTPPSAEDETHAEMI